MRTRPNLLRSAVSPGLRYVFLACSLTVSVNRTTYGQNASDAARTGPFDRLIVQNVTVIPGHGGPAYGPADIVIEGNRIVQIIAYNAVIGRPSDVRHDANRIIDATGMYAMPGLIDLHTHIRSDELPLQYVYDLKLAHGVTTMVNGAGRGWDQALQQKRLSDANRITAPRMFPIQEWGPPRSRDPGHAPPLSVIAPWHDPANAQAFARELVASGAHVIRIGSLAWNAELFGAVARAVRDAGGVTTVHLPPSDIAIVNAVRAAELGVSMIEHHYGFAEAALGGNVQHFPPDYNYLNEADRFRHAATVWQDAPDEVLFGEVVDRLVASGVSLIPTMSTYESNRDINRAMGLPWHRLYTHRQLIEWYFANPAYHASHHWNWTSRDEQRWSNTFKKWQRLVREFHHRGGHLSYAVDDPYLWNTSGIANVRELQLMQEAGLDPLEVIRSATYNSAVTLRQPDLGYIQTGYRADLAIVAANPLENLRYLYAFGALDMDTQHHIVRRGGIRWTIKDGVVFDNTMLINNVLETVAESKVNWTDPVSEIYSPLPSIHR